MWKALILLLWLIVPLSGYLLLRADYSRYKQDCDMQRQDCLARADLVERYTQYYERQAKLIAGLYDRDDTRAWQREWRRLQDALEQERKSLRPTPPSYYPQAAATLELADAALDDQRKAIEQALKQHGFTLDLAQELWNLEQAINEASGAAEYYRRAGSESVYMFIQEILAQREAAYVSRRRDYQGFLDNVEQQLVKAGRAARESRHATAMLDDQLLLDEQRTYRAELRRRFATFNLGQQLSVLLSDLV